MDNDYKLTRRNAVKAIPGLGMTGGLAGCLDSDSSSVDEPETSSEPVDTDESETGDEQESQGLQLNFTWNDILQAELDYYERRQRMPGVGDGTEALQHKDRSFLENANLLNYNEFQNALVKTTNNLIHHTLGDKVSHDSSSLTGGASAAINIAIQEELENNQTYQEQGLDIKMIPLGNDGHGYTQVASTHHPLTTVDSNTPIAGPTEEAPLDERNTRDPISRFIDQDFHEVDELERSTYTGFAHRIYSMSGDANRDVGFDSSIIDELYDQAIFSEDGSLLMGSLRSAVGTLEFMREEGHFDDYAGVSIMSAPDELPRRQEHDDFSKYAEELVDDHVKGFESDASFEESILQP